MTLPDFLVVGAQRAGTTWLDRRLRSHPSLYLPKRRKEIHFFDWYFERGVSWYEDFFPDEDDAAGFDALGEVTPAYLFEPEVPGRIHRVIPDCRIVVVLRDPVDRAYSQYGLAVRDQAEDRSFESYLHANAEVFERGRYSVQIKRYLELFPEDHVFVGIFEEMVEDPESFLSELARFLGVSPTSFDRSSDSRDRGGRHPSYRPRFPRARALARRAGKWLRHKDLDVLVETLKSMGVNRLFGRAGDLPPMNEDTRQALRARYESEVQRLEEIMGRDLSGRWWGRAT